MTVDTFFYENPIFRVEQFYAYRSAIGSPNLEVSKQALQYYLRKKRIISIRRGLFAVVPAGQSPENLNVDPYALAGMVSEDSILAYHTALELHGFAYSLFRRKTFKTCHKIKSFQFDETLFQAVNHKRFVQDPHSFESFIQAINRNGSDIHVTNLASTYVDVLDRPDLSGGWEEVFRSLSNVTVLPINETIAYCLMLNSPVLCAKLGFFLEQRKGAFVVSDDDLSKLYVHRPKSPYYLIGKSKESSTYVKKWNLMIPKSYLLNGWEEPDNEF